MVSLPTRQEVIQQVKARRQQVAAVLPIFYPRELLRAYGYHPIELWGPPALKSTQGQEHFQAYTCAIARNAVAFLQQGGLAQTDLILVPHTCDTLQGFGSVVRDYIQPKQPVVTLYHPRGHHTSDVQFLADELRRIARELEKHSGRIVTEADLHYAIDCEQRCDLALQQLYHRREQLALSDGDFYRLIRSREYLEADQFVELANSVPHGDHRFKPVRLLLSGIVSEPMTLFDAINDMGASVVADDLACGQRRFYPAVDGSDPYRRMAKRLLGVAPEPTRGQSVQLRLDHLLREIQHHQVHGVLVYNLKFCEPELFDLPRLKQGLQAAGVPLLSLEVELGETLSQQTLTRIEAFVETLV